MNPLTIRKPSSAYEPGQPATADAQADQVDLAEYLSAIWRYRTLIVVITLACMGAALVSSLMAPRMYEATVTLALNQSKTSDQVASQNLTAASFRPLVESRATALAVILELGLDKPPYRVTPTEFLSGIITVEELRGTNLIRLVARFGDAQLATKIAQRVAEHAVTLVRSVNADEATQARDIIREQLDRVKARFDQTNAKLLAYRQLAQVEALKKDTDTVLEQRGEVLELVVQIEAEKAKLARWEQELAKRKRVDILQRTIDSDPVLAEASRERRPPGSDLLGLQLQSEQISVVYDRLDVEAALTRANLAALEKQKAQLVDVRKIDVALPKLSLLYQYESELARLLADRDLAEKIYLDVTSRYEVARLQVAGRSAQLQIVDQALSPDRPVSRNVVRNTAVAGIGGLSVAAVVAMLLRALGIASRRRELDRSV